MEEHALTSNIVTAPILSESSRCVCTQAYLTQGNMSKKAKQVLQLSSNGLFLLYILVVKKLFTGNK